MKYEVRKDFNRYLGNWVEIVDARVPVEPKPPIFAHEGFCQCDRCLSGAQEVADRLKYAGTWGELI